MLHDGWALTACGKQRMDLWLSRGNTQESCVPAICRKQQMNDFLDEGEIQEAAVVGGVGAEF